MRRRGNEDGSTEQSARASGESSIEQVGRDKITYVTHNYGVSAGGTGAASNGVGVGLLRSIAQLDDPFSLEVHPSIAVNGPIGRDFGVLPRYVPREHDAQLAEAVSAAADGRSTFAVLVGGSSTGKTRACWEAVRTSGALGEGWRLWHPIDPTRADAALAGLSHVEPRTVVWLNEAQFYLADPALGERVAAGLREVLRDPRRAPVLILGTLWPEHWNTLTTRPGGYPDHHAQARELLAVSLKIRVPDAFTSSDISALTAQVGSDPRIREAAERARDGEIAQYLAGVPVLLGRYQDAPPATRALIHAAMDARRMGCGPRLPVALLADAAPGYLTDTQWNQTPGDWLAQALEYSTALCNGLPGMLTAVKAGSERNRRSGSAPTLTGEPAARQGGDPQYVLADYLDQYGRTDRTEQIPPIGFWTAAALHAHAGDLRALGNAAWYRGLYRDGAQLHKHAVAHGDLAAASDFVYLYRGVHPRDYRPVQWTAEHVGLKNAALCATLLYSLREMGADDQVAALLARNPAAHVDLDDPDDPFLAGSLADFLEDLRKMGADDQVAALLARGPAAHVSLNNPQAVASLLHGLREVGADDQIATLLARGPAAHVDLVDPAAVANLLEQLRDAGDEHAVATLLARDPAAHVRLDYPFDIARLLDTLREFTLDEQIAALATRASTHAVLGDAGSLGSLLRSLQRAGAYDQFDALAARAVSHVALDDPSAAANVLDSLRETGADDQLAALLARDPAAHVAQTAFDEPHKLAKLLNSLRAAGAIGQVAALAARAADHVALDVPKAVDVIDALLDQLQAAEAEASDQYEALAGQVLMFTVAALTARAGFAASHVAIDQDTAIGLLTYLGYLGAEEQVAVLVERFPANGLFSLFIDTGDRGSLFKFGREPDGEPAAAWTWSDLA